MSSLLRGNRLALLAVLAATLSAPDARAQLTATGLVPLVSGLRVEPAALPLPATRAGGLSAPVTVTLTNDHALPVLVTGVTWLEGEDAFELNFAGPLPITLAAGASTPVQLAFAPSARGPHRARLTFDQAPAGVPVNELVLSATAYGPVGEEVLVNAGGGDYVDALGRTWSPDYGAMDGFEVSTLNGAQILGTDEDALYRSNRIGGPDVTYAFELPPGEYGVWLHFAEIHPGFDVGARVFDIWLEGQPVAEDLDLVAVAGTRTAHVAGPFSVTLLDDRLDVFLDASQAQAIISALQISTGAPALSADPSALDFATVNQGEHLDIPLTLTNSGSAPGTIGGVSFFIQSGDPPTVDFSIEVGGQTYFGSNSVVSYPLDIPLAAGASTSAIVTFAPTEHEEYDFALRFTGDFDPLDVPVVGTGGANPGWGYLHPVLDTEFPLIVDYDGDRSETVKLFGSESHTHEPGHELTGFAWSEGGLVFSTEADPELVCDVGSRTIDLTIIDDNTPPATATLTSVITVHPGGEVPGALARYYLDRADPAALLAAPPAIAQYTERLAELVVLPQDGRVGTSEYDSHVMVRLEADFEVAVSETYDFLQGGGSERLLLVDGQAWTGSQVLAPGIHQVDARFAVDDLFDLPLSVAVTIEGQPATDFASGLTHNELGVAPTIHDMPRTGSFLGGNLISIRGFGYFPEDQVVVNWGTQTFTALDFQNYAPDEIQFYTPPGLGTIAVSVETPAGQSGVFPYTYSEDGPVPIKFVRLADEAQRMSGPTTGDWGPDGRFYVGLVTGEIKAVTFNDDYTVSDVQTLLGVAGLTNSDLVGLAFNPFDAPDPVKVYVTHSQHFQNGVGGFTGASAYTGQVSVLTGPNFDTPVPLITGLPTSNFDHGLNGLTFDNNGDMLLAAGGNSNAGVAAPGFGDLGESPLSAAILKAETSRPDFNGALTYVETATGIENDNQVFGEIVDLAPGTHVAVQAPGLRNPYDLVFTTWGLLYCTDNGPNFMFGPASTGPDTDGGEPGPETDDDLNLIEYDNYYGHPNRNRGRYDARQYIFRSNEEPSEAGVYTQRLRHLNSSSDGICEYRSNVFNGAMRGQLIVQKYGSQPRRVELESDRRYVFWIWDDLHYQTQGLDVQMGPGGALLVMDYDRDQLETLVPDDVGALGMVVYDITPWRAPSVGGHPFVVGGSGFGDLANTTVTVGGRPATLTRVSANRIEGALPVHPNPPADLVDVVVRVGAQIETLEDAFRFLFPTPGQEPGRWTSSAPLPSNVGSVATSAIDGRLYLFGDGPETFAYDLLNDDWNDTLAQRPHPGASHAALVIEGKLYLFGGFGNAQGKVQIYDPVTDAWTTGTDMPWSAGGSVCAVVLGNRAFVAGGVVGTSAVANTAVYNPVGDSWSWVTPLPNAVSHAASGTDGDFVYLFGGRTSPTTSPLASVQKYDIAANTWTTSDDPLAELAALPGPRADTGRAVFYRGEFYVFGGETTDAGDPDVGPGGAFPQVFAYDPAANAWRSEAPMPVARHGIDPLLFQSRIFIAGGGTTPGPSGSNVLEIFSRQ